MHSQSTSDSLITKLLDRMHGSDLPAYPLLLISFLIPFAWSYHSSGEFLTATAVAILLAWLVIIPVSFSYILLFLAALTLLTVAEYFAAIVSFFRRLNGYAR